jgi:undecaprenyl-diphosphatase
METWLILLLAVVQGLAELLPVSSSAHVIAVMKLLGRNPSSPEMVYLLMMLHTGTMFAVIVYFWSRWKARIWPDGKLDGAFIWYVLVATAVTGVVGLGLKEIIERIIGDDVEALFKYVPLMATMLVLVGLLILAAAFLERDWNRPLSTPTSVWIGLIQGLCLPFRGFSRSGATISVGLFRGLSRTLAEEYSFALAVVLTPPLIVRTAWRLFRGKEEISSQQAIEMLMPGLLGMVFAFLAGLVALRLLSALLEQGRWAWFGVYCLGFATVLFLGWGTGVL